MTQRLSLTVLTLAMWCALSSGSYIQAQTLNDPADGEQFDNRATIGVDGYITDAPNTVTIKMRRVTTGTNVGS